MNRILIIGQGNIGTFIGAALQASNCEVAHYIRNAAKARDEVILQFNDRRKVQKITKGTVYNYTILTDIHLIGSFEYIIIPVAHHQWKQVIQDLQPYLNEQQTLVLAGNIWDEFDWFEQNIRNPYIFSFPNFGGVIINNQLKGWLTPHFTIGVTNQKYNSLLNRFISILQHAGFSPTSEKNIKGWLMTHFAYNAAMMTEAARQNGFQVMTKKWSSLIRMYRLERECMSVVNHLGINSQEYAEGKKANQPLWWNAFITYLIFLLPGLAKSADAC
jgi:ketopantoate reductase